MTNVASETLSGALLDEMAAAKISGTLEVADGGTAAAARTNLGLTIGTKVQAFDADLTDLAVDGSLTSTKVSPNFGAQNIATTGDLDVGGYTTLGNDASAPAIKTKLIIGTAPANSSADFAINHNLTQSKIIGVHVLIISDNGNLNPPNLTVNANVNYQWYVTSTAVRIALNSATELDGNTYKVYITYEE